MVGHAALGCEMLETYCVRDGAEHRDTELNVKLLRLSTALMCWCLTIVTSHAEPPADQAVQAIERKFSAFNQHDVAAIEGIYADSATLNSPDYHDLTGNRPIAETYRKIFDAIPDAKDTIGLLESAGNHVYVQFVLTGHWNGMQDKPVNVRIIAAYTVQGGRIVEDSTYYDRK
jgi:ketosteroid isomerase-like protein